MRPVELPAGHGMADQPAAVRQGVQHEAGRLQRPGRCGVGRQVQADLVGGRGRGHGHRAAEGDLDAAVQVAADDALHVGVAAHQVFQCLGTLQQADLVHVAYQGLEGRVVHGDDHGPAFAGGQLQLQPLQAFLAQRALAVAGHHGVQRDQPQLADVHGVLDEAFAAQPGVLGKGGAQRVAVIVVAGQQVDGKRAQRRQQAAQVGVFGRPAEVGQVAGDHQGVRLLGQGQHALHRALQVLGGIDAAVGQAAGFADVQVGELGQEGGHGGAQGFRRGHGWASIGGGRCARPRGRPIARRGRGPRRPSAACGPPAPA